jgi:hypothetical protein
LRPLRALLRAMLRTLWWTRLGTVLDRRPYHNIQASGEGVMALLLALAMAQRQRWPWHVEVASDG